VSENLTPVVFQLDAKIAVIGHRADALPKPLANRGGIIVGGS
jgi:hypothetical protein